jgi:hypothetical protein
MRAALSLDLDNKWSYMKTHGDAGWQSYPSYLDRLIPDALQVLRTFDVQITFFVVGQDAALPWNREALAQIAPAGHEIGNHSYHHEPWMHRRSWQEIHDELAQAEESIAGATGRVPIGFRGPGFVRSSILTDALAARGYLYDASSLPTFIGPLARAYYFRSAKLAENERRERYDLFGHFADGFQSNRPHRIYSGDRALAEVPVTTMPVLRLPIHVSYVLYIATISPKLALAYFRTALLLCKATGTEPSILLHPLDFLSLHDSPELAFFPAMSMDAATKRTVLFEALRMLADMFEVMPLERFVRARMGRLALDYERVAPL